MYAYTWDCSERNNSKGWLELGPIQHLGKAAKHFWRSNKTKEKCFEFLGLQIVGRQIYGRLMMDKVYFVKFIV